MPTDRRYLFVSYAREDLERIEPLVKAVREAVKVCGLPVELWMDVTNLRPGEHWRTSIAQALEASIGLLYFVSDRSQRSAWATSEWEAAALPGSDRLVIPVILDASLKLPPRLADRQWLSFVGRPTALETERAAAQIAHAVEAYLRATPLPRAPVTKAEAPTIAASLAEEVRTSVEPPRSENQQNSVFVVHGHGDDVLAQLEQFLKSIGVSPIILSRQDESPQSLFQKFMALGTKARFAIVLLCADDYGASRRQYDAPSVRERALQFRARQNVILELGFFYGRLGWESVFVVYREPDDVFPNFERPSDLDGVVFDSISGVGWQKKLGAKLSAAGFKLLQASP